LGFFLQSGPFVALLAQFPYDALAAKFTISTGIRASLTVLQAFLAIADFHFLAFYVGISIIVKTAFHARVTSFENCKFLLSDTAVSTMNRISKSRDKMQ
jgi:hypothetical protein